VVKAQFLEGGGSARFCRGLRDLLEAHAELCVGSSGVHYHFDHCAAKNGFRHDAVSAIAHAVPGRPCLYMIVVVPRGSTGEGLVAHGAE